LHENFAENPKNSIKYSSNVIAQDDSESVDSLAERVTNSENDSDSQMSDPPDIESHDAIQDGPAISMGAFEAPNKQSILMPHPRVIVVPLDTSLVGLERARLQRETLEEQHPDSGLQSRGDQSVTEAEQLPYHVRCDSPSRQNLQIGISISKTPCHRTLTPTKGILKRQTKWFPDPGHYEMIEIVSRKEPKWDDIPLGRRDFPLYGYFLGPEALIAGKERFSLLQKATITYFGH
jgi:hypothetical protein